MGAEAVLLLLLFFLWSSQDHAEEGRKTQERHPSPPRGQVCKHSSFGIEKTDDVIHGPEAWLSLSLIVRSSSCEALLLGTGTCVHVRTKAVGHSSPVLQTGAARSQQCPT